MALTKLCGNPGRGSDDHVRQSTSVGSHHRRGQHHLFIEAEENGVLLLRFPSHNILQHEFHLRSRINIPTRKKKITYYKGDQQRKPTHDNYDNYDKTHTRYKKMEDNQKLDPQTATLLNR